MPPLPADLTRCLPLRLGQVRLSGRVPAAAGAVPERQGPHRGHHLRPDPAGRHVLRAAHRARHREVHPAHRGEGAVGGEVIK